MLYSLPTLSSLSMPLTTAKMSSTPNSPNRTTVVLDKPSDWYEWIFILEQKAKAANSWNLINPDLNTEPAQPEEPIEPRPQDIREGVLSIAGLTAADRDVYKL